MPRWVCRRFWSGRLRRWLNFFGLETGWVLLFDESSGAPYAAATQNLPPGLCHEPERIHARL